MALFLLRRRLTKMPSLAVTEAILMMRLSQCPNSTSSATGLGRGKRPLLGKIQDRSFRLPLPLPSLLPSQPLGVVSKERRPLSLLLIRMRLRPSDRPPRVRIGPLRPRWPWLLTWVSPMVAASPRRDPNRIRVS